MRSARFSLVLLAALTCARLAPAQPPPVAASAAAPTTAPAAPGPEAPGEDAGALFDRGLEAMMAERYDEGCPLLDRSFAIEPLAGAEFTLAECFAKWGKSASALKHYRGYLEKVESMPDADKRAQGPRLAVATEQIPALEKSVPSVVLKLPPEAPSGTEVALDGVRVLYLGTRQEIDPGEHRAVITLPSGESVEKTFTVAAAERSDVLLSLPVPPGDGGGGDESGSGLDGDTMRLTGLVVGGVGVAAVAVSLILGGAALGEKGDIEDNCEGYVCNRTGKDAADSAQGLALGSTVTFIIGLVAVAAGTTVYLLAPDSAPTADGDGEGDGDGVDAEVTVGGVPGDPASATLGLRWRW